jgi:Arc/MetJ family transcription regulator
MQIPPYLVNENYDDRYFEVRWKKWTPKLDKRQRSFDFRSNVGYYSYKYPHYMEDIMRTVQMTLDDDLVSAVDNIVKKLNTTRSAFARKALKDAVRQVNITMLEKRHKKGYELYPVSKNEFSVWESEQEWSD